MLTFKEFVMESTFNKTYFKTFFKFKHLELKMPINFAILSAGNISNTLSDKVSDKLLKQHFKKANIWHQRVFCISKKGIEKCWTAEITFLEAKALGTNFKQDAFFYIEQDHLFVAKCNEVLHEKVYVGIFTDKITT